MEAATIREASARVILALMEAGRSRTTIKRHEAVVGGRFGADDRSARPDGQLDAFPPVRLARVAFLGHLHIDSDRLVSELSDLAQLGRRVPAEPLLQTRMTTLEDDVHPETPFSAIHLGGTRPADLVFVPTSAC